MNKGKLHIIIFSGEVNPFEDLLSYFGDCERERVSSCDALSELLNRNICSERLCLIFDTLYASNESRMIIRERFIRDSDFTCLEVCEWSDPELFSEFGKRCMRLKKPFTSFDFCRKFFELSRISSLNESIKLLGINLREQVCELLQELGIPVNVGGYGCLRHALLDSIGEPERLRPISKELYISISEELGMSVDAVDHSIRRAINIAWRSGRLQRSELFAHCGGERPTASQFIIITTEYLIRRLGLDDGRY